MSFESTTTPPLKRASDSSKAGGTHGRGRWWKRLIIGMLVLANLVVVGVYWTLQSAQTAFRENAASLPDVVPELTERPQNSMDPLVFLVIGSDSREGLQSLKNFGESDGARGDVIMLIKLYPDSGT